MVNTEFVSILAVDFGSVNTRVLLIDVVGGVYRLVARASVLTTGGFPAGDVSEGLAQAVRRITELTERDLIRDDGRIITPERDDRRGVDMFVATASGGHALRAVLVGLVPDVSVASGQRATEGTYVQILETLTLEDVRSEEEKLNAVLGTRPDLVFIVGGTEAGATAPVLELVELVRTALSLMPREGRPNVLYAGNSRVSEEVRHLLEDLTTVFVANNVRPALDEEDLESAQLQLGLAFDEYKETQGSGFDVVGRYTRLGLLPTAQSYRVVAEYFSQAAGYVDQTVVMVDVGSGATTVASAVRNEPHTTIRTDIGVGHSAMSTIDAVGVASIERWLPFRTTESDLRNYAINKSIRPESVPMNIREMYYEHAIMRAGAERALDVQRGSWATKTSNIDLLIGAGATLTGVGTPSFTAMLLLDVVQPVGVTRLLADPNGLIPALGSVAYVVPEAAVQLIDSGSLESIGTAVSVDGVPRAGRQALRVVIRMDNGQEVEESVDGGDMWVFRLPPGRKAQVRVIAGRGLSIGGKRRVRFEAVGGLAGVVFDARGRPLLASMSVEERAEAMPKWIAQVTGGEPHTIDPAWLEEVEERDITIPERDALAADEDFLDDVPAAAVDDELEDLLAEIGADDIDIDDIEALLSDGDDDGDDLRGLLS